MRYLVYCKHHETEEEAGSDLNVALQAAKSHLSGQHPGLPTKEGDETGVRVIPYYNPLDPPPAKA